MSAEYGKSADLMILASRVNRVCDVETKDDISPSLLEDAQKIVDAFDSKIKVTEEYVSFSYKKPSSSFGGLMSTDNGEFQGNLENKGERKEFGFGQLYEERIGLYKIHKTKEGPNLSLNFTFFMDQVSSDGETVGSYATTHILYDKKSKVVTAIVKSIPHLFKFHSVGIILYKNDVLWGKGKVSGDFSIVHLI